MAKNDAVCVLCINSEEQANRLVLEKEDALAVVNADRLGVNRGEHVLECLNNELKRLVVVREIVQDKHRSIEEGSLPLNKHAKPTVVSMPLPCIFKMSRIREYSSTCI